MKKIVLDSYALINFFRKEPGYTFVKDLLVKIARDEIESYISAINLGELYYMLCRKANAKTAEAAMHTIKQLPIHIVDASLHMCMQAAEIKAKHSLSYADAFAAILTIEKKAVLITGDKEFDALIKEPGFKVKYIV